MTRSLERGDSTDFIDCWKAGHFAVEAKVGGSESNEPLLRRAFRQLSDYVAALVDAVDGADRKLVARHLETLQMLGEVQQVG